MAFKVILIGPIRAGKSTVGKLLAARLGLPQRSLDVIFDSYLDEIGYDRGHAARLKEQGFYELTKYWKPFEPYGVERLVSEPGTRSSIWAAGIRFTRMKTSSPA